MGALVTEMEMRREELGENVPIETIYFGGGTPSVLTPEEIARLIGTAKKHYAVSPTAEITLEANPEDLEPDYLAGIRQAGINRLSIGVQSFRETDMALMNRSHDVSQSVAAVRNAQAAGFENITLDLIYGIPGLSEAEWESHVQQAIELGVPHISAYALTVEPRTALMQQVKKGSVEMPSDDHFVEQFRILSQMLTRAGFDHYEISNFAQPGKRSRHNSSYWHGVPYLGIGPSAHSYHPHTRSWNIRNNALYIRAIEAGNPGIESTEELSLTDRINERLMTGLRLQEGIEYATFENTFGQDLQAERATEIAQYTEKGWIAPDPTHLRLTLEGRLISDHIIAELFWE